VTPAGGRRTIDDYQARLYASYHSTHVVHRKGADDARSLQVRGSIWDRTLLGLLPADRGARVLDGACGNGALVSWMSSRGYSRAEGVDISAEVIADGHALGITNIKVGDFVQELTARPGSFDAVVLRDVLEHFPKPRVLDVLDVVRAGLGPGGRLLLHVPNADSPMFGRVRYGDFTHETAFTVSSLTQVLSATGFTDFHFRPSPPVGTSLRSHARALAWRGVSSLYRGLVLIESGQAPPVVTQNIIAVGRVAESAG
jgi:2-polyprenyl-3-methyl-5-hydroxy-6-metoxy-1,4-benzoquinol methylase